MKLKIKLTIVVILIVLVIVAGVSILLLNAAVNISLDLAMQSLDHQVEREVNYWKGREDSHIRALNTLASVMEDFENIDPTDRRNMFDNMLYGVLRDNDSWVLAYSIWKPNALDGMDAQYIGRPGSSPNGQYAMTVTKETGVISYRASTDIQNTMTRLNGPDARKNRFDNPTPRRINGRDTFVLIVQVPVVNIRTNEVIGAVGALLDISVIQPNLEEFLRENDDIDLMVIYSSDGSIMGHFIPDRIGKNMMDVDVEFGAFRQTVYQTIQRGENFSGETYNPTLNANVILMMHSFPIGDSDQTWSILLGASEERILKPVRDITRITIIVAIFAVIIGAVITYFTLNYVTKPLVAVTETLKDISEGEGDLTHAIITKSNDEIGDLAKYFNNTLEKIKHLVLSIKDESVVLSNIGTDLAGNMNETAAAVNEITSNIQSIKGRVINQSASVSETHATMEQVVSNINKLDTLVQEQSQNISQASSAIEQMVANTNSVTHTVVGKIGRAHV